MRAVAKLNLFTTKARKDKNTKMKKIYFVLSRFRVFVVKNF
jgi:hypothetical protein